MGIYKHIASDPSQAAKKIAPKIQKYLEQVAQASLLMGKGDLSAAGKSAAAQAKLDAEIQLAVAKIGKAKADSVRQLMMKIKSLTKSRTASGNVKPNGNPQDKMLPTPNRVANGGVPDRHMKSVKRTLIDLVNAKIGPFPHKGSKLARGSGSGAMLKKDMFRERLI